MVRVLTVAAVIALLGGGVIRLKSEQNTQQGAAAKTEDNSGYLPPVIGKLPAPIILTNENVLELVRSGMGKAVLIRIIRRMGHNFRVDSRSLVDLKNAGVPEDLILAIVDLTTGPAGHN